MCILQMLNIHASLYLFNLYLSCNPRQDLIVLILWTALACGCLGVYRPLNFTPKFYVVRFYW